MKALPLITAITQAVAIWVMFAIWIVIIYNKSYDLMSIIILTLVVLVFACLGTWESIKDYRKWRSVKNENEKS